MKSVNLTQKLLVISIKRLESLSRPRPGGKVISPQFVRPFVKGSKNIFVDAEAIC